MSQALATEGPRSRSSGREAVPPASASGKLADLGLVVAFLALTFLLGMFPLKDTDFWWHLKAGDLIRETGQVPRVDTFTYGAEGRPWVDLHWGYQVLLSWGYAFGGVGFLNWCKCAITTLAVGLLVTSKRREWPTWAVLLAWLPALLVLSGRMYVRPETISLLDLAVVLAILARWDRKPWLAFGLPIVQVGWVNTQGLFLLEPILIGFALLDAALRPGALAKGRRGWWRLVGLATALTGLACLVNPYGLAGVFYPIQLAQTMANPIFKESIGELKPLLKFIEEVGLDSLPLVLHIVTFALGCASFLVPACWRVAVALADRRWGPDVRPWGFRSAGLEVNPMSLRGRSAPVALPPPGTADPGRSTRLGQDVIPAGNRRNEGDVPDLGPESRDRSRKQKVAPPAELPKGRQKRESSRSKKRAAEELANTADSWRLSPFRALLFAAFSVLSLAATRNSHQFAAVVGTVTAWNFGEWAWAIRARRLRLDPTARPPRAWPRAVAFGAIALTFAAVASGKFYDWSAEGRTVGIGEEPLWFPHEAVKFAGGPGMPDRLVGFHNGYPALYEYYWAPAKKAYTDARLEVVGPELYNRYLDLGKSIRRDSPDWSRQLQEMGWPAVLVDNLDPGNAAASATLLRARHWRCVWFDPIVALFVHDSYKQAVKSHAVDFDARHFAREAEASRDDPATLAAMSRALRFVGSECRGRPGGDVQAQAILRLAIDYARKLRSVDPRLVDGWKQAGMIEYVRDVIPTRETIPRFRLPFDPVFDLPLARATYDLGRALELAPADGPVIYYLATLFKMRGMFEPAVPLLRRYADQPNINLDQQKMKAQAVDQIALLRVEMGADPATKWANFSELDRVVSALKSTGRASTLAEVMESAYRPEARPWEWADRLAVLRLHLGEPARARATWLAATAGVPGGVRLARLAATHLVEGDLDAARTSYGDAIAAEPGLFEAHYGLASLELDAGRAAEAAEQGRLAEHAAASPHAKAAARSIVDAASPYASTPAGP